MCKYGPKCYQANPEHKEAYDHPWVRLSSPLSGLLTTCVYLSFLRIVLGNTNVLVLQSQRYVTSLLY